MPEGIWKKTPVGMLPDTWDVACLDDAASKVQDGTHFSPKTTSGPKRYLTSKNVRFGFLDLTDCGWISEKEHLAIYRRCDVKFGDVLLTKDGANTGNASINTLTEEFSLLSSVAVIRCRQDRLHNGVLLHYLLSDVGQKRLKDMMAGNAIPRLTLDKIKQFRVPVPESKEQPRIAEILDTLDTTIQEMEAVVAKLLQVKAGLLHDLVTRGLDEHGQLRDPARNPEQFQGSRLGLIPKAWQTPTVGEIASHVRSGVTPSGGSEVYRKEGITFVRSQNVTFDGLLLDDVVFITPATHAAMNRSEIFPFDVLLNITGASIGRCCYVPDGFPPANVNQHVCALRLPKPRFEDGVFLTAILASHIGQSQIDRLNAGGNREGLNYTQVRSFVVPWPEPDERKAIANRIEAGKVRLQAEELKLSKLQSLKRGLAHDLLTGHVRVKI